MLGTTLAIYLSRHLVERLEAEIRLLVERSAVVDLQFGVAESGVA